MKRYPQFPVLAGVILCCTILPACAGASQPPSSPEVATPATPAIAPDRTPGATLGWADILGPTSAPEGWQVTPCINPSLLCVEAKGEIVGTVELIQYPASDAPQRGIAPLVPGEEQAFLQRLVDDYYTTIVQDRGGADPTLVVTPEPTEAIAFGSLPGLRYGLTTTRDDGTLFERMVGYMATDGDTVYLIVTGLINNDPTGSFSEASDFAAFEPHGEAIVEGLRL
jgi:hypothetical protein